MPYARTEDLPDSVRNSLPSGAQSIFLAAFNSAFDGTCKGRSDREGCAARIAWSAVGKSYHKTDNGWVKNMESKERVGVFSNAVKSGQTFENSTLQTLNRWIPDKENGHYFALEAFEPTVESWNKVPIVFASDHPDLELFAKNPEEALAQLAKKTGKKAVIAGHVNNVTIETGGHPRLKGKMELTDPDAISLWHEGKLSPSTAFFATRNTETRYLTGDIEPNHVLVFEEDEKNLPKDKGALVNKEGADVEEITVPKDKLLSIHAILNSLSGALQECFPVLGGSEKQTVPPSAELSEGEQKNTEKNGDTMAEEKEKISELEQKLGVANKEASDAKAAIANKDAEIADLKAKLAEKDTAIGQMTKDLDEFKQKAETERFESFLAELLPGATHTAEEKTAFRQKWDNDPKGLAIEVAKMKQTEPPSSKSVGREKVPLGQKEGQKKKGVGNYNPNTGKYE